MTTGVTTALCMVDTGKGPCRRPVHKRGYHDPNPPTLRVPRDGQGRVRVSISQLRRYGAVDLATGGEDHTETVRGCPRAYALTYGADPVAEFPFRPAELGIVLHRAIAYMEDHAVGPGEALGKVWPATLGPLDFAEAGRILDGYLSRGGPMTLYATLASELDITAELFVDDEHGPVMFRGIIDHLAVDADDPDTVHVTDLKSAARPVARDALRGDVQLMGYTWLVREWWRTQHGRYPRRVIAHFDALRYGDTAIEYTRTELDIWSEWAAAMIRTMLRDRDPQPILNDGCSWCPVRWSCPAWLALPGDAQSAAARLAGASPEELGGRYTEAARVLRLLASQVDHHKDALEAEAKQRGVLRVGDQEWRVETGRRTVANVLGIVDLLLPDHPAAFEQAVTATHASVEKASNGLDLSLAAQLAGCVATVKRGERIAKRKAKKGQ